MFLLNKICSIVQVNITIQQEKRQQGESKLKEVIDKKVLTLPNSIPQESTVCTDYSTNYFSNMLILATFLKSLNSTYLLSYPTLLLFIMVFAYGSNRF